VNTLNLVGAARAAEASGQIERAAQLCRQALYADPKCAEALQILGGIAARQGRTQEAETLLRQAATLDPNSYDAARWLTTLLIGRDGGHEAVDFGLAAVRLRPREAEAHVVLGLAALGNGDNAGAIASLQRAIELSPRMSGAYHNLGVAYQRDESFDESIAAFRKAIELSPNVAETYLHLARSFLSKSMADEALECAQKATEMLPSSKSARRLMADAYLSAVHGPNGEAHIRRLMDEHPDSGLPHSMLSSRLQEHGDFEQAETSGLRSIELEPVQGHAYYVFVHNRKMREGDRPIAEKMEEVVSLGQLEGGDLRFLHFALGKIYDDLGDYEKAMRNFDLAHGESASPKGKRRLARAQQHPSRAHRFMQLLTKEYLERFDGVGLESAEPIFIVGMPRSGTTLMEQIVSRHSTVGAAGELFFWRDSGRHVVSFAKGKLNSDELQMAGRRYLELIRSIAPGMAHVTDKFPSNYVYLGMLQLVFPNAKFIHMRRHPIDTCLSIYMRPFLAVQDLGQSREKIVETYRQYRQSIQHWRETLHPGSFLDVDYERLVQHPEEVTRSVIEYCGLEWEDACLHPEEGDRRVLTFSKWQVRQPVYTTSLERWRRYEPWLGEFHELIEEDSLIPR
jgi:tetratricopeptide (TPR) repeat protein